jgi:dephospho-CoA kinase
MALRKYFGEDAFSKIIFQDIEKEKNKIIVLDGVRRPSDIKYLKDTEGFYLIFIEADLEERFKRLKTRKEKTDDREKKIQYFKKEHQSEVEMKIRQMKKVADFVIDNNQNRSQLSRSIDAILAEIRSK